jgi:formylglycine-generating enzyme required for sulfatase activity
LHDAASVSKLVGPEQAAHRVMRGGSWDVEARNCRAAVRDGGDPQGRDDGLGFRAARGPSG